MTARDCLALLLAGLVAAWGGYAAGARHISDRYEAELATIHAAHAEQERSRAEAVAAAEKNAREALTAATARGETLARELAAKAAELDAERASVNRRIRDVSEAARRHCAGLSLEWVRLYNEALYGSGHSAGSEGPAPGGTQDAPASARAARARVQPDALATPEDVLAHVRDYGLYCRRLEAGYRGLADFVEGQP